MVTIATKNSAERQPLISKHQHGEDKDHLQTSSRTGNESEAAHEQLMKQHEHLLTTALYPIDVFKEHTYWADLPVGEKAIWIKEQASIEAQREWQNTVRLAKDGIFQPAKAYLRTYAISGVGFFVEGYVLFSVGNNEPLFQAVWPQCWDEHRVCDAQTIKAIKYMEIVGIICGQITIGYLGDAIGRRWGLVQDAAFMLLGVILLTAMWAPSLHGWTVMYAVSLLIFGFGVGGEYPMTSTSSIENQRGATDRAHRGRAACLAFLMQGWGQLANQLVLIALTVITSPSHSLNPPYTVLQAQVTFRTTFLIAAGCLVYFLYLRVFTLRHVDNEVKDNRRARSISSGYDWNSFRFLLSHFWARLFASSICWFCSDFAFYGLQVFRNDLLELVTGSSPKQVNVIWLYNLINIGCQLVGYYMAALFIDRKSYGRRRMQLVSFGAQFILYVSVSCLFPVLDKQGPGAKTFQAIYFLANFWIQFGSNSTSFLIAAEIFPVGVRSTAHGFSAAVGKLGALAATISFNYLDNRTKFIVSTLIALLGLITTLIFVPDTTGLGLAEMQRAWGFVVHGEAADYHGIAVHMQHLSLFERYIRKHNRSYDIVRDRKQRIEELRKLHDHVDADIEEGALQSTKEADDDLKRYFDLEREIIRKNLNGSARCHIE